MNILDRRDRLIVTSYSRTARAVCKHHSIVSGRCPLAGRLLVHLLVRFTFGSPSELEHGVEADFPDSLLDCGLLFAEDDFVLVFVAA